MFKWLKSRVVLLKNDKELLKIFLLHILLIALHVYENYVGTIWKETKRDRLVLTDNNYCKDKERKGAEYV